MSVFLQPIYTQTVGSGGASSITFNNIPQTFTDLKIEMSIRSTASQAFQNCDITFNGNNATTLFSETRLGGNGTSSFSDRFTGSGVINLWETATAATSTSNTFSNIEVYIPNYTSSNYKQIISDTVGETNASAANQRMFSTLWGSSSSITQIGVSAYNLAQYSTISLYGVLRQGI